MLIIANVFTTSGTDPVATVTLTNCKSLNLINNNSMSTYTATSSNNSKTQGTVELIQVTKANAKVTITGAAGATGIAYGDFYVLQLAIPAN